MAEVVMLPRAWEPGLALAIPSVLDPHPAGLGALPAEWVVADGVTLRSGTRLDHVVVGPNGVFAITVDGTATPATIGTDGLYRNGSRVALPVKRALLGARELRGALDMSILAYPVLITALEAPGHQLDRLGVVPADRLAEHIWSHPGFPLRRSQRVELQWGLRSLLRG
jgi:hypothetical protein